MYQTVILENVKMLDKTSEAIKVLNLSVSKMKVKNLVNITILQCVTYV